MSFNNGCPPAACAAEILDKAMVPNLLWGWWANSLVGVHQGYPEVEFVVADDKLDTAVAALVSSGLSQCTHAHCPELSPDQIPNENHTLITDPVTGKHLIHAAQLGQVVAKNRYHLLANHHFHLHAKWSNFTVLRLYAKSRTLWWLPDIPLGPVPDENMILSNDPRLPASKRNGGNATGPWDSYPVKVLKAPKYFEALTLLRCVHWGSVTHSYKGLDRMTTALFRKLEDPVYAEIRDNCDPKFKAVWDAEHGPRVPGEYTEPGAMYFAVLRLRKSLLTGELAQSKNMPPLPDTGEQVQLPEDTQ